MDEIEGFEIEENEIEKIFKFRTTNSSNTRN